jgi:hypothetical protein
MGVTATSGLTCCKNLTILLEGQQNLPSQWVNKNGVLLALKSEPNMAGYGDWLAAITKTLEDKAAINTTFPKIDLQYLKPDCGEGVTATDICTAATVGADPYGYASVKITGDVWKKITLSRVEYDTLCYSQETDKLIKVTQLFDTVLRAVNADITLKLEALMGNYADGVTSSLTAPRTINLIGTNGQINPAGIPIIENEFNKLGVTNGFTMVGGSFVNMYQNLSGLAVANSSLGIDATKVRNQPMYFDSGMDALLTATGCKALTWANGTVQLMESYRYNGDRALYTDYDVKEVREYNGVMFDFTMHYDACTDKHTITARKSYDLFYVPTAAFSCLPSGANLKLQWKLACGDMDCSQLNIC